MSLTLSIPEDTELRPRITVIGVGGAGGNAVNNMIQSNLEGCEFVVCNTDAQAISNSLADRKIQLGIDVTKGLGAGSRPEVGMDAAEASMDEIISQLDGSNMVFITAGMGGGTGTGAAPVIARAARERDILTVGVVTKPFTFEGQRRMQIAERGIEELQQYVDTLIIIPNQNLFRIASERTTFAEAFNMADDVLHSGVRGVTDLMVMPGLINLDFADVRTVMSEMGKAMMGTGEATGDKRALEAAESAIANPLLDDTSMKGAKGLLISVTGGSDMTLFEVDEACNRIRDEVDSDANIIFGATFDEKLEGSIRVSIVSTGIEAAAGEGRPAKPQLTIVKAKETQRLANESGAAPLLGMTTPQRTPATAGAAMGAATAMSSGVGGGVAHGMANSGAALDMLSLEDPAEDMAMETGLVDAPEETQAAPEMAVEEAPIEETVSAKRPAETATAAAPEKVAPEKADSPVVPREAFIPPKATTPPRQPGAQGRSTFAAAPGVDAFKAAEMENASGPAKVEDKPRNSLFQRVTGLISGRDEAPATSAPATSTSTPQASKPLPQPTLKPTQEAKPTAQLQQAQPTQHPMDRVSRPAAQPRLGGLDKGDRLADKRKEEDTLEIPAFLRRQAN